MPPAINTHLLGKDGHGSDQLEFKFRFGLGNMTTAYFHRGQVTGLCLGFPKKSLVCSKQILADNIPF